MPKNYISNDTTSIRMFRNGFMESLSKVHYSVPLFIYLPVIAFFIYRSIWRLNTSIGWFFIYLLAGIFIWTITEYLLHRYIFHFVPKSKWGLRLHFIFHGVHHDYPRDAKRLVMPPSASIPLALLFYLLFIWLVPARMVDAFFAGFLIGYLVYDMTHYAIHHGNFKSRIMKSIKQHHMLHHYADSTKGYGVSSSIWDIFFQSGFKNKK
ncbi:MAG TPA: sterol desaturase family protein [Chitinophagaceae bacterium]|nr:sterol desaturase family protein [Chitinophagaceae bacterium]